MGDGYGRYTQLFFIRLDMCNPLSYPSPTPAHQMDPSSCLPMYPALSSPVPAPQGHPDETGGKLHRWIEIIQPLWMWYSICNGVTSNLFTLITCSFYYGCYANSVCGRCVPLVTTHWNSSYLNFNWWNDLTSVYKRCWCKHFLHTTSNTLITYCWSVFFILHFTRY